MSWFALVLNADFGYSKAHCVRADGYELAGDVLVLRRDERVVHQAPRSLVARLEAFETQAEASKYIARLLDRHGAASLHVQELGSTRKVKGGAARQKGGFLAESFSVQLVGTARHPGRG